MPTETPSIASSRRLRIDAGPGSRYPLSRRTAWPAASTTVAAKDRYKHTVKIETSDAGTTGQFEQPTTDESLDKHDVEK